MRSAPRSAITPVPKATIVTVFAASFALSAFIGWGCVRAGFIADDWFFLALGNHVASPGTFFVADHSLTYFYRPFGVLSWWGIAQVFGDAPLPQYALNLVLHAINAALVSLLAHRLGAQKLLSMVVGLLFAIHPTFLPAALWLSDRFDLLATAFVLGGLIAVTGMSSKAHGILLATVMALLGSGSKELSVVLIPAVAIALAFLRDLGPRRRLALLCLVALAFVPMLTARYYLVPEVELSLGNTDRLPAILDGAIAWLRWFPRALLGLEAVGPMMALVVAGIGLALCVMAYRRTVRDQAGIALLVSLAALLPLAALIQSPVTSLILAGEDPLRYAANGRFYYLAGAAFLPLLASGVAELVSRGRAYGIAFAVFGAAVGVGWSVLSTTMADRLAVQALRGTAVAAAVVRATPSPPEFGPCLVSVVGVPADVEGFSGFVDVAVKAQLHQTDARLNCIFRTEDGPHYTLTRESLYFPCADADRPELVPRMNRGVPLSARSIGTVCIRFPQPLGHDRASFGVMNAAVLEWDPHSASFRVTSMPRR